MKYFMNQPKGSGNMHAYVAYAKSASEVIELSHAQLN